jgi:hypothetical protein
MLHPAPMITRSRMKTKFPILVPGPISASSATRELYPYVGTDFMSGKRIMPSNACAESASAPLTPRDPRGQNSSLIGNRHSPSPFSATAPRAIGA